MDRHTQTATLVISEIRKIPLIVELTMIVLEAFLLAFIIAFARTSLLAKIQRTSFRQGAVFEASDTDKVLVGYKIMHSVTAPSLMHCTQRCIVVDKCRSINFKEAGHENNCQILDIDKRNANAQIQRVDGWIHYEPIAQVNFPFDLDGIRKSLSVSLPV